MLFSQLCEILSTIGVKALYGLIVLAVYDYMKHRKKK